MYIANKTICDDLFSNRRSLSVLEFMLKEKADCAFMLLDKKADELIIPTYIQDAIKWLTNA